MGEPSQFTIRDDGSALIIRAQAPWKLWQRLGGAAIAGVVVSMAVNDLFHVVWWPFVGLAFGALMYFSEAGMSEAELRVSALECYSKANFSKSLMRGRTVFTADILWLEYNEQQLPLSDTAGRRGLYAARRSGNICLLPLLDGQQTMEVIAAIEGKFAGLSEGWRKNSPWGKSVQTILSR
jgi:hypothetical protein